MALAVLIGSVTVSGYHRSRARRAGGVIARSSEPGFLIAGRLAIGLPLFGGALAYAVHPDWMAWASFDAPLWLRWVGVAWGLLTVPAVHWVLRTLGRNVSETILTKQNQELVTQGPYRWIRHPLYTAGVGMFLALGLMAANAFMLLFAFLALVSVRLVVVPAEERQLRARFGPEFEAYRRRTGCLFPRLRSGA